MKRLPLLDIILCGILFNNTWSWDVYMPQNIHALHRSCLVIPCSYFYTSDPPHRHDRVVWYQYVNRGYPLVYDNWYPQSVIERYKGRTSVKRKSHYDCSLLIKEIDFSHNGDRLYTWIDPENVECGLYCTFKFYERTTVIHVDQHPHQPNIYIKGGNSIGDTITIECRTYHSCPDSPPSLSLSGIERNSRDNLGHNYEGSGKWEITLTREGVVNAERQEIYCSVRHLGGHSASRTITHNAKCSIGQPRITPYSNTEFLEGVTQDIICSVTYMCSSDQPRISWSKNLNAQMSYVRKEGITYEARSTLQFTAKANDHGRSITCQVQFKGKVQTKQIILKVKKSMKSRDWSVTMPSTITGIRGSCVVIPCSYKYKDSSHSGSDVKWYEIVSTSYSLVYDKSTHNINDKFKGKTSLIGSANERNCSLKITELDVQYNQFKLFPWMDTNPIDSYHQENYQNEYIELKVTTKIEKPQVELLGIAIVGKEVTLSCSVLHTCPSPHPNLSLSIPRGSSSSMNTLLYNGIWKASKDIKWTVEENDKSVTCTVNYNSGLTSETKISINPLCPVDQAQITPDSNTEFLEGVEYDIVCSVTYMCTKDRPYISWIGKQLPDSRFHITKQGTKLKASSMLKFTPKASDNGEIVACQADFQGNVQTVEITLKVQRSMGSLDWSFTMPSAMTSVRGSCVVIPCNYEFKNNQQRSDNIKWYKLSTSGYALVFDQSTNNINNNFKGKTSLLGSSNDKNCSLKIQPLEMQHSQEKLFPWMDPNSIESYHTQNFDHVTIVLEVTDNVETPQAELLGVAKVGEPVTLSCSVLHTCPTTPPILSLSISRGTQHLIHTPLHDGKWKLTKEITWTVEENDKSVTCTVKYTGGQTSKTEININPLCDFQTPVISPTQEETMEGIEKSFTCTVNHTCQNERLTITWNYQHMPVSLQTHKVASNSWNTVSTLKLKPSRDDHGKALKCIAQTIQGETSDQLTLKVKRGMFSLDWTYSMPSKIKGLRGSCLVIPCSFDFKTEKLDSVGVKWYLYSKKTFSLVYGPDTDSITGKFFGKTRLCGSATENNCSLEIKQLEMHHNGDRLYPWMDQKSVETFHRENYYDKSIELQITEQADKPKLSITGIPRVGEQVTVSCSVLHTCPSNPPHLSVGNPLGTDITLHNPLQDGFWEVVRVHTFIIKEDEKTVTCKATFPGGQTSAAQLDLNAQCTYKGITIDPEVADIVEGVGQNFTCTVFHSCKSQLPTFTWNYEDLPMTVGIKKGPSLSWATFSNALFIASLTDDGKKLTCTATFTGGDISTSIVLQVQRFVPKFVDPFENDTLFTYVANVVPKISALTRSCVVIPCTFQTGDKIITRLRSRWHTSTGEYVFHTGQSKVMDNFKGRTRLLGNPDEQNCTLEINNVQAHDNGPFCFHAEKENEQYSFNHSCVFIIMKASPDKPVMSVVPEEMEPGKKFTISCSVTHTCSSHPPIITWNVQTAREVVSHVEKSAGKWEKTSTITFIPTGYEKEGDLICRATFWKGKYQESSTLLTVKRYKGLDMNIIGFYIILPLVSFLLLCIATGIIIYRRRGQKKPSRESTPEKRRSIWSQISRRYDGAASWLNFSMPNSGAPSRPPRPEKRRSIWSRFSRRSPVTNTDLSVHYNACAEETTKGFSKPHFPSPKSEQKTYISGGANF